MTILYRVTLVESFGLLAKRILPVRKDRQESF